MCVPLALQMLHHMIIVICHNSLYMLFIINNIILLSLIFMLAECDFVGWHVSVVAHFSQVNFAIWSNHNPCDRAMS